MTVRHSERINGPRVSSADAIVEGGEPLFDWHQAQTALVVRSDCFADEGHLISGAKTGQTSCSLVFSFAPALARQPRLKRISAIISVTN